MSEHKEQLSAYLDDALAHDEVDVLLNATQSSDAAVRYHIMGEAMRGELSEISMLDVSTQVREAVADTAIEQSGIEHSGVARQPAATTSADENKPGILAGLFDFSAWLTPVGGFAVAASVALVVVVGIQQGDVDTGLSGQVVATTAVPQANVSVAKVDPASNAMVVPVSNVASTGDIDLDRYMDEHSEFAARDTMQGRLPYVRAVGYKSQ